MGELEREVAKYAHLCAQMQDYQTKLLEIAEYWVKMLSFSIDFPIHALLSQNEWMSNGEHLVRRETIVLGLPTSLELMIEERRKHHVGDARVPRQDDPMPE